MWTRRSQRILDVIRDIRDKDFIEKISAINLIVLLHDSSVSEQKKEELKRTISDLAGFEEENFKKRIYHPIFVDQLELVCDGLKEFLKDGAIA